jgi:hypothetical protein
VAADWVLSVSSTGHAAHLGKVTVEQEHCTRIDIFTVPNPGVVGDGRMTVTAADGDELWLAYTATFVFVPGASPDVGVSTITATMTIVGGTGRFEGATGSVMGHAIDNFPAGPHTADFSGTIAYDPAVQAHS